MDKQSASSTLGALRIVIGLVSWVAPNVAGRLFGLDVKNNPQAPYLARLFGIRDLVMGIATLTTSGETQASWLRAGVMCDVADTAAALRGGSDGYLPTATTVMLTAPAVAATALGVAALQGGDPIPA